MTQFLNLPLRTAKPRQTGKSILIDNGYPLNFFTDVLKSHTGLIDVVKLGWGTSIVTENLIEKTETLKEMNIPFFFGGTLFEKSFLQNKTDQYFSFCKEQGASIVEISDGTIDISPEDRHSMIKKFGQEFEIYTEVGFKDQAKSQELSPAKWISLITKDIESGASKVILEARESGSSGICRPNGEVRYGLIEEVIDSGLPLESLIFESPNKKLQSYFIKKIGTNVNLGNISFFDVVALETLRLGLRSETLDFFNV